MYKRQVELSNTAATACDADRRFCRPTGGGDRGGAGTWRAGTGCWSSSHQAPSDSVSCDKARSDNTASPQAVSDNTSSAQAVRQYIVRVILVFDGNAIVAVTVAVLLRVILTLVVRLAVSVLRG